MDWLRRIYRATLGRRRMLYDDLGEEIRQHLEEKAEQLQREGLTRRESEQAARRAFGNTTLLEERSREVWLLPRFENLLRDFKSSARLLKNSPGFTLIAVITLTLGIGANTAIFSLIDGLLLRPLPVPHANRLVVLYHQESYNRGPVHNFSSPVFRALEKHHGSLQEVAAYTSWRKFQVRGNSGSIEAPGSMVSGQFFKMLQTPPLLGRYLTPVDDNPDSASNEIGVVISESFWRKWFNKAPDVVGRTLTIANAPFTVVGVMPARFIGANPTNRPQLYVPLSAEPVIDAPYSNTKVGVHNFWLDVMGRLKPGVSLQEANKALKAASDQILGQVDAAPRWIKGARKAHYLFGATPGSKGWSYLRLTFKKPLIAVFGLCGIMLLLACLNLASLLMARSAARERELATRLAVGATRGRLIQQLLMDSLLLATLGAGIGLLVSPVVSESLAVFVLGRMQDGVLDTALDFRVFLFAVLIAFAAAILVGLVPALRATSGNLNDWLKDRSRAAPARDRHRLWLRSLMGLEVALALILVIGSGLLATSLVRLYRTGLGFDPNGLVNLQLNMDKQPLQDEALIHWYEQFGQDLSHQPGVRNVSFENHIPLGEGMTGTVYRTLPSNGDHALWVNTVAPNYFATMRIPLLSGREFRWADKPAGQRIIILNQAAAKLLYGGKNPIGQHLTDGVDTYLVVGVAGDTKYGSVEEPTQPEAYLPITQDTNKKPSYTAVARIDGPAAPLATEASTLLAKLAPDVPAPVMTTMNTELNESISSQRMMAMLASFFAVTALLVTAIGLYGVLAYSTARRTSEIGVRMALGARRTQVVVLVFRENLWSIVAGCAVGMAAALAVSRMLASFLYGISARNPWVLCASMVLLCIVATIATLIPAIRAASIEPMDALRCE